MDERARSVVRATSAASARSATSWRVTGACRHYTDGVAITRAHAPLVRAPPRLAKRPRMYLAQVKGAKLIRLAIGYVSC